MCFFNEFFFSNWFFTCRSHRLCHTDGLCLSAAVEKCTSSSCSYSLYYSLGIFQSLPTQILQAWKTHRHTHTFVWLFINWHNELMLYYLIQTLNLTSVIKRNTFGSSERAWRPAKYPHKVKTVRYSFPCRVIWSVPLMWFETQTQCHVYLKEFFQNASLLKFRASLLNSGDM